MDQLLIFQNDLELSSKLKPEYSLSRNRYHYASTDIVYHVLAMQSESTCWELMVLDGKLSEVSELQGELCIPNVFSGVKTLNIMGLSKKDTAVSYRAVVTTDDAGVLMFQKEGRVVWSREEALSEVTNVQFVDLPLSDIEAHIEEEFTEKPTGVLAMFVKRISSQLQQLATFFEPKNPLAKNFGLVRDNFGFHKVGVDPACNFTISCVRGRIITFF